MEAAEAWGTRPWKIAGGKPLLWYVRYEALVEARIFARDLAEQEARG